MSHQNSLRQFLARADHLATALDIQRSLAVWDNQPSKNSPIDKMFSDRENIIIARAIVQYIKPIQNNLLSRFGTALHQKLIELLEPSIYQMSWQLKNYYHNDWTKRYAGSGLFPKLKHANSPHLYILIQRNENKINLGICRSEDTKQRPTVWNLLLTKELEAYLVQHSFRRHSWWLGIKQHYDLREDELWLAASGNLDQLVDESARQIWQLLVDNYELLTKTNEALAESDWQTQ